MSSHLEIQLVCSPIGCPPDQRATVRGLGLRKTNDKRVVVDTPELRGMIFKVKHLVSVLGAAKEGPRTVDRGPRTKTTAKKKTKTKKAS